ncbi:exodeoxyribonuclease VII small subunit [Methylophilaceae bacterium]|jgi:exodeoxyribonuclease VII small subunit|nr:exodeoxyribonuclease VII small subunit [Methylophilaceae bacterium]|tara:strand:- start:1565 stop:1786 length:222 start_codon:yes stop_codon:yes gene_type:complete
MAKDNINIEKMLKELESIVTKMEDDSLNLEDSLESYEKGINLVKSAQESLKKIEQRVQILSQKNELEDFNPDD